MEEIIDVTLTDDENDDMQDLEECHCDATVTDKRNSHIYGFI